VDHRCASPASRTPLPADRCGDPHAFLAISFCFRRRNRAARMHGRPLRSRLTIGARPGLARMCISRGRANACPAWISARVPRGNPSPTRFPAPHARASPRRAGAGAGRRCAKPTESLARARGGCIREHPRRTSYTSQLQFRRTLALRERLSCGALGGPDPSGLECVLRAGVGSSIEGDPVPAAAEAARAALRSVAVAQDRYGAEPTMPRHARRARQEVHGAVDPHGAGRSGRRP
jgi:hypothetical protein